jgi:serine/threonine-protein kinase
MFLDEARIVSQLHHGNIVHVIDYGTIDGAEFLAMEFVDGVDARRAVKAAAARGESMPLDVSLRIVVAIAHALDYAHGLTDDSGRSVGIVHRDVTPQNVLLSWNGDVLLSDFGIALSTNRDERTKTGLVKGKLGFIAPEQLLGKDATSAVDIFGLGATLHAMLTGDSPVEQVALASGVPMHLEIAPELPSEVRELIAQCMSLDPQARPTARQLASRCSEILVPFANVDGRTAIRDWLAGVRADFSQRNGLDDLMQMVLVPMNAADPKTLTVMRLENSSVAAVSDIEPQAHPQSKVRRWPILLLSGALFVGASAFFLQTSRHTPAPARVLPEPQAPPRRTPGPSSASPPGPALGGAKQAPAAEVPTPQRKQPAARAKRAAASRGMTKTTQSQLGWLRVGGASLAGGQVSLDRRPVGFAPLEQVVSEGPHELRVTDPKTGRVILRESITISSQHSRSSPLRVMR